MSLNESWFVSIFHAYTAFRQRKFEKTLLYLQQALAAWQPPPSGFIMDNEMFNAWFDSIDMVDLMSQNTSIMANNYLRETVERCRNAISTFENPVDGNWELLHTALEQFKQLIDGLMVGVRYMEQQKLTLDHTPPLISFEITEDGYIHLYGWLKFDTDSPQPLNHRARIEQLRYNFDALFAQEKQHETSILEQAQTLFEQQKYQDCIHLLQNATQDQPKLQLAAFLQMGDAYNALQQYSDAVDCWMKAFVLGCPRERIKQPIREVCNLMIDKAETKRDRERWEKLLQDF